MGAAVNSFGSFGVVGAGQMGSGIAQVGAQAQLNMTLVDTQAHQLDKAQAGIATSLAKLDRKGRLQEPPERIIERIQWSKELRAVSQCDFVVEAVPEQEQLKFDIFRQLDRICRPETLLATNTSSLSITRIARQTKRPSQVIGMHFMNPVPLMRLVEVIPGEETAPETVQATTELAVFLGKETIEAKDMAGFIVNHILLTMINSAIRLLSVKASDAASIDKAMTLGANQPIGPLALADMIGLDTCLAIMETLHREFGDDYRPARLLQHYVATGRLGRKTGRGIFEY